MKNLKIGITLPKNFTTTLWSNGITLNILFLAKSLQHSINQYDVSLLSTEPFDVDKLPTHLKSFKVQFVEDVYKDLDMIVILGSQLKKEIGKAYKDIPGKKLIAYFCGNNYLFTMEQVLFKPNDNAWHYYEDNLDEVWYVPQQHENNVGYCKTLYRTNAIPIPFVWDTDYISQSKSIMDAGYIKGTYKKDSTYTPKEKKTIAVMEPNINMIKVCIIPSLVVEECYRTKIGKEKIQRLMLMCADKISKDKTFLSLLKSYDIFKDKKVTSDGRYQTAFVMTQHADILVSHQMFNALNYLYLDAVYLGYPVLHNAWMCKDLAYYYDKSNVQEGAKQLEWILEHHDNVIEEYTERNKKVINRYLATNSQVVATYDKLIDNLYNGSNKGLIYNHTTNLYTNLDI